MQRCGGVRLTCAEMNLTRAGIGRHRRSKAYSTGPSVKHIYTVIAGAFCTSTSPSIRVVCGLLQQIREAFPYEHSFKYLIFDRDAKFGNEVFSAVNAFELASVRTSFRSPWQNGVAERWVGSCRRDLLDHVIGFNERHLKRLVAELCVITMTTELIWDCRRKLQAGERLPSVSDTVAWCRCRG
jgi:hypothetical protein